MSEHAINVESLDEFTHPPVCAELTLATAAQAGTMHSTVPAHDRAQQSSNTEFTSSQIHAWGSGAGHEEMAQ